MSNRYGANAYRQTSVMTAGKPQIMLMLYEGAIKNINKAIECIQRKDLPGKGVAIGKAHDIVNELSNTLNMEMGGDVAKELERLYDFCVTQFIKANVENSVEPLQGAKKVLETLLEGWRGAVEQISKGNAGGAGAP